jgi:exodeoxyribonuclease V beta subunit
VNGEAFDLLRAPLEEGTVLLEASAGTGKTYALVGIVLRLLLEGRIEAIEHALVVTYTNAAAEELKNRLRNGLRDALAACAGEAARDPFFAWLGRHGADGARTLRRALAAFDQVQVATIHGFCKRLLDEAAFASRQPFAVDFAADELPLLHRAAEDALRSLYADDDPLAAAILHGAGATPDRLVADYRLWQRYPDVALPAAPAEAATAPADLAEALADAGRTFDAAVRTQIATFPWLKGSRPFHGDGGLWLAQLERALATAPAAALGRLLELAPSSLREALHKRKRALPDTEPFFAACERVYRAHAAWLVQLRADLLRTMHGRVERHKQRERVMTFSDLLVRTHDALQDPARREPLLQEVRARHRVALIDEFQDTDSLQYGIFTTCFRDRPLFLIGDPKQAIYGFRGADVEAYLAARPHALREYTLDVNYRSSDALVRAIGCLFDGPRPFVHPDIPLPAVRAAAAPPALAIGGDPGAALQWRFVPPDPAADGAKVWIGRDLAEPRLAADVAAEVVRLLRRGLRLDGGPFLPRHVAVLTRTNLQALAIQDALREAGVASAIGKAGDVFATDELTELERLMMAILQPRDLRLFRAALTTRVWGFDAEALQQLERDEARFAAELERLDDWRRVWLRRGFVVMFEQLSADLDVRHRLLAHRDGERRLTNWLQLVELLHASEHQSRLSPEGLLQWLRHERLHQEEIDSQRRELRLESDDDAVQILTVHGSKGLEYEVVFCPFLWDGRQLPTQSVIVGGSARELAFAADRDSEAWRRAEQERLSEDLRLCYVALTRAKRRCYVYWGSLGSTHGGAWRSALAWLLDREHVDFGAHDWQDRWSKRLKGSVHEWRRALEARVAASGGTMSFAVVPARPEPGAYTPPAAPAIEAPRRAARVPAVRRLHSFSSLVADAEPGEALRDVADPVAPAAAAEPVAAARDIFAFARGARAGQCLHEILERVDLADAGGAEAERLVRTTLARYGLDRPDAHAGEIDPPAAVVDALRALSAARVHADGPALAALCRGARIAEWQFLLPAEHSPLRGLADCLAAHGTGAVRDYATVLARRPPRLLRGYLTGFADLVAEHEGSYWLLDWKSNHLGDATSDYHDDAVRAAMIEHDYVLQYHLYALALHRHLRARLRGYVYERHFGGVCYAFLRGAAAGTASGMYFDRPPRALVDAMDRWAEGHGGGA